MALAGWSSEVGVGMVESNWFEGPTEHQAQSFAKPGMPEVVRAGQTRQWWEVEGKRKNR